MAMETGDDLLLPLSPIANLAARVFQSGAGEGRVMLIWVPESARPGLFECALLWSSQ